MKFPSSSNQTLLIEFNSYDLRAQALRNGKFLQNNQFNGKHAIFVNPDLTVRQRLLKEATQATKQCIELARTQYPTLLPSEKLIIVGFDLLAKKDVKNEKAVKYTVYKTKLLQIGKDSNHAPYAVNSDKYKKLFDSISYKEKLIIDMNTV